MAYWRGLADKRTALIFGPVLDPDGMYGIAIIETNDETVVQDIGKNDPAIRRKSVSDLRAIQCQIPSCENKGGEISWST